MPGRPIPLVNDHYYHIYNRGVARIPIFLHKRDYQRFLELMKYYRFANTPFSFSKLHRLGKEKRAQLLNAPAKNQKELVKIIGFCLMPNHFHLLLGQSHDNGISQFLAQVENSYTRYFNTKNERKGPLLEGKFHAVLVETEEQLLHLSRYIHLNPYSSAIVKSFAQLKHYPWSSLPCYLSSQPDYYQLCQNDVIMTYFKDGNEYEKFLANRADYQRNLEYIKHLLLE